MLIFKPIVSESLHMEVINSIITAIALGELKPGEKIIEQNIAEQMRISRAPVREAIRELSAQGIIEYIPRKGATVAALDFSNIAEVYSLRACLEGMAINLAVDNITVKDIKELENLSKKMTKYLEANDVDNFIKCDVEFHNIILMKSCHKRLQKLLNNLILQTKLYMLMSKHNLLINSRLDLEYGVHDKIIDEIKKKDKIRAEEEMKKHIFNSGETLVRFLENKN
ncbi:MAG: GntR family transcriptional regulator [Fusobacteriaceae bacterium]|nr:GntR family transcriptional regulator [Fusobacteriaceae bacterium]